MTPNPRLGIAFALVCLGILGVMPILAGNRPAGYDGLTFTVWLTIWQLICALPLTAREFATGSYRSLGAIAPERRLGTLLLALLTGAIFAISTYMYVVAAEKAGPVNMAIGLQAYPLFAILLEWAMLGKRKSALELAFTALMIAALVYLTTGGSFRLADVSWWTVFVLAIPVLWAVAHILLRVALTSTPITPNQVTASRLVISCAFLLAIYAVAGARGSFVAGLTDPTFQRAAFILGLAYYLELVFWFSAVRHIEVSVASSVTVPTPALTMLIAVAFTGAHISAQQIVALAAIVIGMYGLLWAGGRGRRAAVR